MNERKSAQERILHAFREERIWAESMLELIARYAAERPERLCVADPDEALGYGEFYARILKKAGQLAAMGVRRGERVAAYAAQRADYLALQFAAHRLGAVFVPLEKNLPEERAQEIAERTEAKLLLRRTRLEGPEAPLPPEMPRGDELATILYTTGTTGRSKGIALTHRAEVAVAQNVFYGVAMEEDTVEMIPMPVSHSYGLRHCFGLLLGGRSVVLCDGVAMAGDFFALMDRYAVNALSLTPATVNILLHLTGDRLGSYPLRYLQLGTAGVDSAMKDRMRALLPGSRLYQYYSSTEAGCACIFDYRNDFSPRRVGRPACNSHFIIVDDSGQEIQSSESNWGLIACWGPMNMSGYWRDEALSAEVLREGYVLSQDVGYLDAEGYLCFIGRRGDVINTGGYKVSPEEVEEAAMYFGGIRECACAGAPDALLGQAPELYVVPEEPEKPFDKAALSRFLAGRLEAYKLPRRITLLEAVPRNYMGKPQRGQCAQAARIGEDLQ